MTHYSDDLYSKITNIFKVNSHKNAAEGHGVLCGIHCATGTNNYLLWEQEVTDSGMLDDQARSILKEFYIQACKQLDKEDFSFTLLLPDDEQPLRIRAHALGYWCQGFYLGLMLGGCSDFASFSQEVYEFTEDLAEIAQIGNYMLQESEQDEASYMQLVEYVRAGVQLTKEELTPIHQQRTIN